MEKIELSDYSIFLGEGVWTSLNNTIDRINPSSLVVLCDAHTRIYCLPKLMEQVPITEDQVITVPSGEVNKNLDTCRIIWKQMMERKLDRNALLLNLGGGVIGDMGGFCAATFKRGIRFIQLPTTLLSQVDASIGGKLGIDFDEIKNSIGVFKDPEGVFIHTDFLNTLPARELRSGFAEVIKHALIGNAAQWETIYQLEQLDISKLLPLLEPSLLVKKIMVEADPFEHGQRKLLNFGHTIGHAIESYFLHTETPLLHGEAIAIGMVCEAYLSNIQRDFSLEALSQLINLVHRMYGTQTLPPESFAQLIYLMENDKKNRSGKISFSLLKRPGDAIWDQFCSLEAIQESLTFYNNQSLSLFAS